MTGVIIIGTVLGVLRKSYTLHSALSEIVTLVSLPSPVFPLINKMPVIGHFRKR